MIQDNIEFDLRALSVYEEALIDLDNLDLDCEHLEFAFEVVTWFESHWIVTDDYTTFYPSKRFRRKNGFDFDSVVSEFQKILGRHCSWKIYRLTKAGEQA